MFYDCSSEIPKLKYEHYKSVELLSNIRMSSTPVTMGLQGAKHPSIFFSLPEKLRWTNGQSSKPLEIF